MNNIQEVQNELLRIASAEGMALFGVANIEDLRESFLIPNGEGRRFTRALSIGYRLSVAVLRTIEGAPNQTYYFHYQRANILLDQTALKLTALIQREGYEAFPVPASQLVDWERQLGTLSHREIGRRAGFGWYGRNNLLVTPRYGSQVRYATVLTDLPLVPGTPREGNCGSCRACVEACPAKAIGDGTFDRAACHEKLKEFMRTQKIGQMICGVCVNVCRGAAERKP